MNWVNRVLLGCAGLIGAIGVATAAAASHVVDSRNIAAISAICLAHGPVLVALGLYGRSKAITISGVVLLIGTILFCGDLALRQYAGHGLFPMSAPIGGGAMILGWLGIAVSGAFSAKLAN